MPTTGELESAVLQTMLPQLEAEGFDVFLQPSRSVLPPFLQSFAPDAIALKGDKKVAIEVVRDSRMAEPNLKRLREALSNNRDWELGVVYARALGSELEMPAPSIEAIEDQLQRITVAFEHIGPAASLLVAWSVFEATGRAILPKDLGRPQTPAHLVEVLASQGCVTPDEADILRRLGRIRNEAAHGRLDVPVTREELQQLAEIARHVLGSREASAAAPPG